MFLTAVCGFWDTPLDFQHGCGYFFTATTKRLRHITTICFHRFTSNLVSSGTTTDR
jgi:hypothetical protein